jgi:hypothetical protein
MLASQSLMVVPLATAMVSCRPVGFVAARTCTPCATVVMLAVPSPALSTSGPYVKATAF